MHFNKTDKIFSLLLFEGLLFIIIITSAKIPASWSILNGIKFFSPTIFAAYLVLRYRKKINFPLSIDKTNTTITLLLYGYGLLSLIWSSNLIYGINKLIGLLLIELPLIISAIILIRTYGGKFLKVLQYCFILVGILLTIFFFVTGPFSYTNSLNDYGYTHVGYGRLISYAFLLAMIGTMLKKSFSPLIIIAAAFLGSGLVLSGLRGALIAVIVTIGFFLYNHRFTDLKNAAFHFISIVLFIFLFVYFQPSLYKNIEKRISNLSTVVENKGETDGSISARMRAYEISFNMFLDKPFFGQGIGGFNQIYKNNELPKIIEYPHNLFVEIIVELGVIGFILFGILLWRVARNIRKINEVLFLLLINGFMLSLFSGNIVDQKIVLVLLGTFTVLPNMEKNILLKKVVMRENYG